MVIGVPRETHRHEHRVGLTPFVVARFTRQGHTVLVESKAGVEAHFTDRVYQKAGAQIVYSSEEVYRRAELICRVSAFAAEEVDLVGPGSTICAFHHLAVAHAEKVERFMELGTTLIGYEIIRDASGELPVLYVMSEVAGQLAMHIAAYYLQNESGGRGILMGNVPGIPPPTVLILGAGTVGRAAARQAVVSGAHPIVLDADLAKLRTIHDEFQGQAVTAVAGPLRLRRYTSIADIVIGAVLVPGARAPFLITEEMVQGMKPGSVIIDASIDQGGCVETSRPTTLDDPTFVVHDVVHYCVPNMTANVARTASRSLANGALPYLMALADKGLDAALRDDPGLADGVYLYRGQMVNASVAEALGMTATPLGQLINEGARP
jgi:alanine dehydrogenase